MNKVFNLYLHILTFIICFKVEVMMEGIIQAFLDRVSGVGWIDNQTVEAVREKVRITRSEKQFHDSNAAAFPNPLSQDRLLS